MPGTHQTFGPRIAGRNLMDITLFLILRRVLRRFWEGFGGRAEKGACYGFYSKKGSQKGFSEGEKRVSRSCLERPLESTPPIGQHSCINLDKRKPKQNSRVAQRFPKSGLGRPEF